MNLEKLNPIQQQAVLETEGPVMLLAGAGSGKTRTLVARIAYLLEEKGVGPYQLLALTFSNKAAREMRERISREVGTDVGALQVTTFHAFCAKILRNEASYIGLGRNFTIYDTSESKSVVKNILEKHGISPKEINPYEVLYYIDDLKNNGHYRDRKSQTEFMVDYKDVFYTYYKEYEEELSKANAVDFGGLIIGVLQLFETYPDVLKRYEQRFKYVLVDEYQDTNRAQFELICALTQYKRNICVVGDEDQSIYSWRGADIRNILDFEKIFPDTKLIKLEQNYRSSRNIIKAATCVIEQNILRKGKTMWTDNPDGESIEVIECTDDRIEAEFVSKEISKIKSKNNCSYGDFAVFYRTNAQSRMIEESLRKYKIPYRVIGGVRFYERKEIKDVLAYMRLVVNPKDSLALSRIINVPARGIGVTTLRKLEELAIMRGISLWEILLVLDSDPEQLNTIKLSAKIKAALAEFTFLIKELDSLEKGHCAPSFIYEKILRDSGLFELLKSSKDYESQARVENLEELGSAIGQYEQSVGQPGLSGFLESITLDTHVEGDEEQLAQGEVSLMTVHGAKGLEFPYVFLVGAEENIFPSYKGLETGEKGLEEERRLFYVAMTRAMEKLFICFAYGRMLFGQVKFNGPSRFINEIPEDLYRNKKIKKESNYYNSENEATTTTSSVKSGISSSANNSKLGPKFPEGSKVFHSLYGKGKVLECDGVGNEEKVLILFSDGAKKRFMVKFAPLNMSPL